MTFGKVAECLRDIKVYAGDVTDPKVNDQLKKAIGKINFSPKRDKRSVSRNSDKNKKIHLKKMLDDSNNLNSLHGEIIEENMKKIERSMKVITPEISSKNIPKIHVKTKSKKNKYGFETKETGVNRIKNFKGVKSAVIKLVEDPKIQFLFCKGEDLISSSSSSSSSELNERVNTVITRRKIKIK